MAAYDPFEDDQLGQPPASVPPGDPRAGLYAYLAQQAAVRAQGQAVPSYEQVQQQAKANADRSAANAFGAQLQNSASMMGTLNGKRSDYGGTAELAKSLDNSGQEELAGNYQALAQRNKDVLTEGSVYKDLSNPDLARARLYATLGARNNLYDARRDIADKNNQSREAIADKNIAARKEIAGMDSGTPGQPARPNGTWRPVYPKDGSDPYLLDGKTGVQKPLPKGFQSTKDRAGVDANGDPLPVDPNADETLMGKDDTRDYNKLLKDSNPALASSRSDFGKNQATVNAAKRLEPLYAQGIDQKNGLNPIQMRELATAAAALIGGGSSTAQSQVEHMTPQSVGKSEAEIFQWLSNEPRGANQMAFAKQLMDTARREGHLANENLNTSITSMYNNSPLYDKYPKRMANSYYSKVGDDAAYDEQGRYIQEPLDESANGSLRSVGQSPMQLQQSPSAKAPGAGSFGPEANPDAYNANLEQEYARAHNMSPARARAILELRRRKNGG